MGAWRAFVDLNRFAAREAWSGHVTSAVWNAATRWQRFLTAAYFTAGAALVIGGAVVIASVVG